MTVYTKAFFDLQWQFVDKVIAISGLSLPRALLDYTNFYIRFGCCRDFEPSHPIWQAYLTGLHNTDHRRAWTYRFYLTRNEAITGPPVVATFGCFSYAQLPGDLIRLHFHNADIAKHSSLGSGCVEQRHAELIAIFGHVLQTLPAQVKVIGVSWLYNLDAYRRLFPSSYIATARVMSFRFRSMALWGQFLDRHGELKEQMTRPFLERLNKETCVERMHECFPFQVLTVEASVQEFYDFYGVLK